MSGSFRFRFRQILHLNPPLQVDYNRYGKMDRRDCYSERPLVLAAMNIRCHHRCRSAVFTALLLAVCASVAGSLGWLFWQLDTPRIVYHSGGMRLIVSTGEVTVWRDDEPMMSGSLGLAATQYLTTSCGEGQEWDTRKYHAHYCERFCGGHTKHSDAICGVYGRTSNLSVSRDSRPGEPVTCQSVAWQSRSCAAASVEDCYCMEPGYWVGGSLAQGVPDLRRPAQHVSNPDMSAWSDRRLKTASAPCSYEPYDRVDSVTYSRWEDVYLLYSGGIAFFFPRGRRLTVRFFSSHRHPLAAHKVCFRPAEQQADGGASALEYSVCYGENIKSTHTYMADRFLRLSLMNDHEYPVIVEPMWDIPVPAARSGMADMTSMQTFQSNIARTNFSCHLGLFHGYIWDDYMNSVSVKEIIPEVYLKSLWQLKGVSILIHPFVDAQSPLFQKLLSKGSFLGDYSGMPLLVRWHARVCAIMDFSNSSNVHWFKWRLRHLQNNVRSLSFSLATPVIALHRGLVDAGRVSLARMSAHITGFATALSAEAGRTHGVLIFGSDSLYNGLLAGPLNHTVLQLAGSHADMMAEAARLSLLGFTRLLSPGQNSHFSPCLRANPSGTSLRTNTKLLSPKRYMSELLAASLLPGLVIPIPPWCFADPVISQRVYSIIKSRRAYFSRRGTTGSAGTVSEYTIFRPFWWIESEQFMHNMTAEMFTILDQVVVDGSIIAFSASSTRDIYLPRGEWYDSTHQVKRKGGTWYRNYRVLPGKLPIFSRTT